MHNELYSDKIVKLSYNEVCSQIELLHFLSITVDKLVIKSDSLIWVVNNLSFYNILILLTTFDIYEFLA